MLNQGRGAADDPVTYSIVARCPDTGMLGISIASHVLAVGRAAAHDLRGRQSAAPAEAGCPQEAQQSWARITGSAEADRWIELLARVIAAELVSPQARSLLPGG